MTFQPAFYEPCRSNRLDTMHQYDRQTTERHQSDNTVPLHAMHAAVKTEKSSYKRLQPEINDETKVAFKRRLTWSL